MDRMRLTGTFGWTIVVLTVLLAKLGLIACFVRVRRPMAVALVLAAAAPLGVGLMGYAAGKARNEEVHRVLREPTEHDLSFGEAMSSRSLGLGAASLMLCEAIALVALLRSERAPPPGEPPAPAAA